MAVLAGRGEWQALAQLGEDTLFVHPASPEVHQLLGRGYLGSGRAARALVEFDRALSLGHPRAGKVHQLAAALFQVRPVVDVAFEHAEGCGRQFGRRFVE